jgi:ribose transport system permease protein
VPEPEAPAAPPLTRPAWRLPLSGPLLGLLAMLLLFVLLLAGRGGLADYLSLYNLQQVMHNSTVLAVVALGMLLVVVSGGIDLSVGSVAALATVTTVQTYLATMAASGSPALASLAGALVGVATGGLCGLFNGWAITGLKLSPFVATLGMMSVARGAASWLSDKTTVMLRDPPSWVRSLNRIGHPWLFFDPGVYILAVLAVLMLVLLRTTVFGRYCYAIGSNEATARLCGVDVGRTKIWIYVIAGLLTGWAGVLTCAQTTSGDPRLRAGLELEVIAAVVIGGASLSGGRGTVGGALLGVLIWTVLDNGIGYCGLPVDVKYILMGGLLLVNTALSQWQQRRAE